MKIKNSSACVYVYMYMYIYIVDVYKKHNNNIIQHIILNNKKRHVTYKFT